MNAVDDAAMRQRPFAKFFFDENFEERYRKEFLSITSRRARVFTLVSIILYSIASLTIAGTTKNDVYSLHQEFPFSSYILLVFILALVVLSIVVIVFIVSLPDRFVVVAISAYTLLGVIGICATLWSCILLKSVTTMLILQLFCWNVGFLALCFQNFVSWTFHVALACVSALNSAVVVIYCLANSIISVSSSFQFVLVLFLTYTFLEYVVYRSDKVNRTNFVLLQKSKTVKFWTSDAEEKFKRITEGIFPSCVANEVLDLRKSMIEKAILDRVGDTDNMFTDHEDSQGRNDEYSTVGGYNDNMFILPADESDSVKCPLMTLNFPTDGFELELAPNANSFSSLAKTHMEVTVGYIEFDSYFTHSPDALDTMGKLFQLFDRFLRGYKHLVKVKSRNASIMFAGGLDGEEFVTHSATEAVLFADELRNVTRKFQETHDVHLNFRCGISSGMVLCGVTGRTCPSFDCWGENVNMARKLVQHAPEWTISINAKCMEMLRIPNDVKTQCTESFRFIKGAGNVKCFDLPARFSGVMNEKDSQAQNTSDPYDMFSTIQCAMNDTPVLEESSFEVKVKDIRAVYPYNHATLQFSTPKMETSWKDHYREKLRSKKIVKIHTWLCLVCAAAGCVFDFIFGFVANAEITLTLLPALCWIPPVLCTTLASCKFFRKSQALVTHLCASTDYIVGLTMVYSKFISRPCSAIPVCLIIYPLLSEAAFFPSFIISSVASVFAMASYTEVYPEHSNTVMNVLLTSFFIPLCMQYSLQRRIRLKFSMKQFFKREKMLTEQEKSNADAVLSGIFTEEFVDKIAKAGDLNMACQTSAKCTVFYLSIANFSQFCKARKAMQVSDMLDVVFSEVDHIMTSHGIKNVKIFGDSYMCVCPSSDTHPHATYDVMRAAIEVLCFIDSLNKDETWLSRYKDPLKVRIGVAVGPLTYGVVRTQIPSFDCWGAVQKMAENLEETADPGTCHISLDAFRELYIDSGEPPFEFRKGDEILDLATEKTVPTYMVYAFRHANRRGNECAGECAGSTANCLVDVTPTPASTIL